MAGIAYGGVFPEEMNEAFIDVQLVSRKTYLVGFQKYLASYAVNGVNGFDIEIQCIRIGVLCLETLAQPEIGFPKLICVLPCHGKVDRFIIKGDGNLILSQSQVGIAEIVIDLAFNILIPDFFGDR
jgi:hypothetical protein